MKILFNILITVFTLIGVFTLVAIYYNRNIKKRYIQITEEI
jgi:hypothetical protein